MRSPLLPALLLAALPAAAADAPAGSLLDRPAPPVSVSKWVTGTPPPSWRDLKGRLALMEVLDPGDLVSQGLVSRTAEIARGAAERGLVLFSVAVNAGEADAKAFAGRFKVTWPLGVDDGGKTYEAAGLPPLPRYLLAAPDGTVVWEGSPAGFDDRTLATFLERARLWRPAEVARALRPAAEAFAARRYGEADRLAREARAKAAAGSPEEKDADLVEDAVKFFAETRMGIAAGLAKERDTLEAVEILEGIEKGFKGSAWAERARAAREGYEADPRGAIEIRAGRRLRDVLQAAKGGGRRALQGAVDDLENFLKEFGNLRTGEKARAALERLRRLLEAKPKGEAK